VVLFAYTSPFDSRREARFTKFIKGCSNRIIASSYAVVVLIAIAILKLFLILSKIFLPAFMRLVALPFLKSLFWKNFVLRKQGIAKKGQQQNIE
jgi:hypothetical protein